MSQRDPAGEPESYRKIKKSGNIESQIKTVKSEACKRTRCQPCISPQSLIGICSLDVSISQMDLQLRRPSVFHPFTCFFAASLPPPLPRLHQTVTLSDPLSRFLPPLPRNLHPLLVLLILVLPCSLQECLEAFPLPNSPRALYSPVGY